MFVADLYLTLSYFVSFVHDYCDKLTNYRAIIFKFSHLSRDNCSFYRAIILTYRAITGHRRLVIGPHFTKNIHVRTNVIELICNFGGRIMIDHDPLDSHTGRRKQ